MVDRRISDTDDDVELVTQTRDRIGVIEGLSDVSFHDLRRTKTLNRVRVCAQTLIETTTHQDMESGAPSRCRHHSYRTLDS